MFFWFSTASIVFVGLLFALQRSRFDEGIPWKTIGIETRGASSFSKQICKSGLVAFLIGFWLYSIVFIVDTVFHLDFRAFLPFLSRLTVWRGITAPLYLLAFLPYFLLEGIWLFGILSQRVATDPRGTTPDLQDPWCVTYGPRLLVPLAVKGTPFLAIILLQLIGSVIVGKALLGGFLGFQLLFLYVLLPFFVLSIVLQAWGYRVTKRVYVGSWLNAILFAWAVSALLPLQF